MSSRAGQGATKAKSLFPSAAAPAMGQGFADVAELVDALDLGSSAARRGGSSPLIRTKFLAHPPPAG